MGWVGFFCTSQNLDSLVKPWRDEVALSSHAMTILLIYHDHDRIWSNLSFFIFYFLTAYIWIHHIFLFILAPTPLFLFLPLFALRTWDIARLGFATFIALTNLQSTRTREELLASWPGCGVHIFLLFSLDIYTLQEDDRGSYDLRSKMDKLHRERIIYDPSAWLSRYPFYIRTRRPVSKRVLFFESNEMGTWSPNNGHGRDWYFWR